MATVTKIDKDIAAAKSKIAELQKKIDGLNHQIDLLSDIDARHITILRLAV